MSISLYRGKGLFILNPKYDVGTDSLKLTHMLKTNHRIRLQQNIYICCLLKEI